MRTLSAWVVLCLLSAAVLFAQQNPKRIYLSPKSNITTSEIARGLRSIAPTSC